MTEQEDKSLRALHMEAINGWMMEPDSIILYASTQYDEKQKALVTNVARINDWKDFQAMLDVIIKQDVPVMRTVTIKSWLVPDKELCPVARGKLKSRTVVSLLDGEDMEGYEMILADLYTDTKDQKTWTWTPDPDKDHIVELVPDHLIRAYMVLMYYQVFGKENFTVMDIADYKKMMEERAKKAKEVEIVEGREVVPIPMPKVNKEDMIA